MKNVSVQQPFSFEPLLFPLSSRAKPRDLRFPRTFRGNLYIYPQTKLSSRPERSVVERSAVSFFRCQAERLPGVDQSQSSNKVKSKKAVTNFNHTGADDGDKKPSSTPAMASIGTTPLTRRTDSDPATASE